MISSGKALRLGEPPRPDEEIELESICCVNMSVSGETSVFVRSVRLSRGCTRCRVACSVLLSLSGRPLEEGEAAVRCLAGDSIAEDGNDC